MRRVLVAILFFALGATAQIKFTVEQLVSFVKSSVRLKHPDAQVAAYLKKVNLTEQLPAGRIEDLLASGMGPKTYDQLQLMVAATASLPVAKVTSAPTEQTVAQLIPPPSPAEQRKLVEELREYALNYDKT
ncbi:MAG: hypothetical protein NTW74_11810, partial [Acidobacteria bacterium]|nr:hypothetical protein [Acidobacteriota bacterium]